MRLVGAAAMVMAIAPTMGSAVDYREYSISSHVHTTLKRTVVPNSVPPDSPAIFPYELSKYAPYGYGQWHYGPGVPSERRFDIMASSYTGEGVAPRAELVRFFSISDMHLRDKESPAQAIYWGYTGLIPQPMAYSGTMLYTTQILDATIRTVNELHKKTPFDFGISLGDECHATQHNELRWFIDVLDGKVVTPSSGDNAGSHSIDYQRPYKAAGLNKEIPWYAVMGNGDRFWYGFLTPNGYIRHTILGRKVLNLGNPFTSTLGANSRGFYMGVIDGKTPYGTIVGVGPQADFKRPPKIPADDESRRSLSKKSWMGEFFKSSSHPKGHGFTRRCRERGMACYTFRPKSKMPILCIVLDDLENRSTPANPQNPGQNHGFLDAKRYRWLIRELDKGQAQGKLMIVMAHIAVGVEPPIPSAGWLDPVFEANLVAKLHTYPNLLMWVCGHYHRNNVTPVPSPDSSHPELGFWVVETASLLQFPQQFRTFRIVRNSDNTLSFFVTNVDPAVAANTPAARSRTYAIGAMQIFKDPITYPPSGAYNAELFKQLTPKMQRKIQKIGISLAKKH